MDHTRPGRLSSREEYDVEAARKRHEQRVDGYAAIVAEGNFLPHSQPRNLRGMTGAGCSGYETGAFMM